ncbi:cbb3-type cytochrome c oxidase subunit II [Algoriphagus boritolerans]|uniref:Cytochrome c oxidase cbb3-type subunit 2 n=2 Tax=Algoriphagus TaxID=246875 RepID=A0A1H5ZIB7_9BACT|nr:cbb3-type cytochrome c oxidase subunit II [Algoriphagus boritolerans]SEG35774.1 cytochrome c oxidase cbb3-type subunit 2 [Algoriphagus boritolerans DSM 17298 = JCM 18970]
MFDFHKNHKLLVITSFLGFAILSTVIAVFPALQLQKVQPLPGMKEMSSEELKGLQVYVSENCMACHTQQVRNIEMDHVWGQRPSLASDYYYSKQRQDLWRQSPSLLGSERTGPDLTEVGKRQPGKEWHLLHLFNPRIVVKESVMPSYPWLFEEKSPAMVTQKDVIVPVPGELLKKPDHKLVAKKEALELVAYLQSLVQTNLGEDLSPDFIPSTRRKSEYPIGNTNLGLDGLQLYTETCSACHQPNGEGIAGAFPPLVGSKIVNDPDPNILVQIILSGYDARPEFGVMPGFADLLTDEEISAIATHERQSWGNQAPDVTPRQVAEIRKFILNQ